MISWHREFLSTPSARRATFFRLALLARSDRFLSTPSARRATSDVRERAVEQSISIHALREEGDRLYKAPCPVFWYFYPRPPRGGRPAPSLLHAPARRISIHALREEGDAAPPSVSTTLSYFYPRPPRGGRHDSTASTSSSSQFLSTPSARRATRAAQKHSKGGKFLSTPSARRATGRWP